MSNMRERRRRHFDFLRENKVIDRKGKLLIDDGYIKTEEKPFSRPNKLRK